MIGLPRPYLLLALFACCGGPSGGGPSGGSPDAAGAGDAAVPAARCDRPALSDVSSPTAVVGDGTPASCTAAALQQAATGGGTIVFHCGAAPVTITVSSQITFTRDTVLDGGGMVTLSGGGSSRILLLDSAYDTPTPRLVVQRLTFRDGKSPATGADTAQGGAAIYRDGGSLTVLDSVFDGNHAPATGQDVAGGAIYGFGGGDTLVAGSTFTGNTASDGGAIGSLNSGLTVIDSVFTGNAATGTGGNPGNGGAGGALYMDGGHEATSLCGLTIQNNTAGAIGGGVFRVSNDHTGSLAMDRSTVDSNRVTATGSGNAGGLYLEGLALTITASTISRNQAFFNGGIWINTAGVDMTNTTIAENVATGSNGGGMWLGHTPTGTLRNCTIASNRATAANQIAGAIFGDGLALVNTIVAGNTAMFTPGCDVARAASTGDLQWPGGALCTAAPLIADPMLGALGDHGGGEETLVPAAASPARGIAHDCPPTDQRGHPRPDPCTAGAAEPD
ncbi:MAG TPA: choice-of-anchor Q domain-containing protein [Kofleriaceae bacterium]|nr:choice-of-anchor Q domain-containing protein [Kofleriaceae bacterium]